MARHPIDASKGLGKDRVALNPKVLCWSWIVAKMRQCGGRPVVPCVVVQANKIIPKLIPPCRQLCSIYLTVYPQFQSEARVRSQECD